MKDTWEIECSVEDFCHLAASTGWKHAARGVEKHLKKPPKGDEWSDDYAEALRGIAEAFRRAEVIHPTKARR